MKKAVLLLFSLLILSNAPAQSFKLLPNRSKAIHSIKSAKATKAKTQPTSGIRTDNYGSKTYYTYDTFGNVVERINDYRREVKQYDPTGTYLIKDIRYYRENIEDQFTLSATELETTFDAKGIRTGVSGDNITEATFDKDGRVTKIVYRQDNNGDNIYESSSTLISNWNGNKLTRLEYIDTDPREPSTVICTNFNYKIDVNFNTMSLAPQEELIDEISGIPIEFDMEQTIPQNGISIIQNAQVRTTINSNGKEIIRTAHILNGQSKELMSIEKVLYKDENGSYVQTYESYEVGILDFTITNSKTYNEYGDLTAESEIETFEDQTYKEDKYYSRKYSSAGKPLYTTCYSDKSNPENTDWIETYDGYDPTSISSTQISNQISVWINTDRKLVISSKETQVYGATIYRLDGTTVNTLSVQEMEQPVTLLERGIYIIKMNTTVGEVIRKVAY